MTKARDIASAAPAPSTVSATELGYVDGVTSAIQTQIDAKEATLPSQTGNSGKYLTTDGSAKSWGAISSGSVARVAGNSSTTTKTATFSFVTGIYNVNITGPIVNFTVGSKIVESTGVYSLPSAASATISLNNQWFSYNIKQGNFADMIYGNNLFVGTVGDTRISTSPDGKVWTSRTTNHSMTAIGYNNNLYVGAGDSGLIQTSTDAITWTTRDSTTNTPWQAIVYGDKWIVGGNTGGNATSTDGITWTTRANILGNNQVLGLTYGNSLYVAVGAAGKLQTSTDGITWTSRDAGFGISSQIRAVTFGNGLYVAGGQGSRISTSTDGVTWTTRNGAAGLGAGVVINTIVYADSTYIAAGEQGRLATSTDGITWTSRPVNFGTSAIQAVAYGAGLFVAAGEYDRATVSASGATNTADDVVISWNINSEVSAV